MTTFWSGIPILKGMCDVRLFIHSALQADIQLYNFHESVAGIKNIIFKYVYVCMIVGTYGD